MWERGYISYGEKNSLWGEGGLLYDKRRDGNCIKPLNIFELNSQPQDQHL